MSVALPIFAGLLSAVATLVLLRWRTRLPQAVPNARSLHPMPIPRVGGVAIWAGWLPIVCFAPNPVGLAATAWVPPWVLLVLVSLRDDCKSVPVGPRLFAHALAAAWMAAWLTEPADGTLPQRIGLVMVYAAITAWSLNLYNFMDGSDGLAPLAAVIGFGAYGIVAQRAGVNPAALLGLAAAALPLFVANRPPARLFIGDVGAVPLGFLAAAFGLEGMRANHWPWWFPLLVFLPFVADATATLARRLLRGERVWEAHRSHYYQRLHQLGAGHRGTLAVYGALMSGTAGTALVCASVAPRLGAPALIAWCAVCAVLFVAIDYHWRKHTTAIP